MRRNTLHTDRHSKKGITLVELIVAMTLTAMFAVVCVSLINPISRIYQRTTKITKAQLLADTIVDAIRKECDDADNGTITAAWIAKLGDSEPDDRKLINPGPEGVKEPSGNVLVFQRNNNYCEAIYACVEVSDTNKANVESTSNPDSIKLAGHSVVRLFDTSGNDNRKEGLVHFGYYQSIDTSDGIKPERAYDYTNPVLASTYGNYTVTLEFTKLVFKKVNGNNVCPAYVNCTVNVKEGSKTVYSRDAVISFSANGSGKGAGGGQTTPSKIKDIEVIVKWDDEGIKDRRPAEGILITLTNGSGTVIKTHPFSNADIIKGNQQKFVFKGIDISNGYKVYQTEDPAADGYLKAAISKNSSGFVIKNKYSNLPVTLLSGSAFNAIVQKDKVQHVVFGSEADIRARVSLTGITPVKAAISGSSLSDRYKLYYVSSSNTAYILSEDGYFIANPDCSHMFEGCKKLTSITWNAGTEGDGEFLINTNDTTNMASMFKDCSSMKAFNVRDLVQSSCGSLANMFDGCTAAESINNIDTWNTSGVQNMNRMFYNYAAKHDKNKTVSIDISSFKFDKCEDMQEMFANGLNDKGVITEIKFPAGSETGLTQYPLLKTMEKMFYGGEGIRNITNLNNLNCPELLKVDKMFDGCKNINTLDLHNFKMPKCEIEDKYNKGGFIDCNSLQSINLDGWDISSDTDLRDLFSRKKGKLKSISLNNCTWPSTPHYLEGLFYESTSLTSVSMIGAVTNKCISIRSIFYGCSSLKNINLQSWNWDTSGVKYWRSAFANTKTSSLDLTGFSFESAVDMAYLFQNATASTITLPRPDYECTDCECVLGIFNGCKNITEVGNFRYFSFPHTMKYGNHPDERGANKMFGSTEIFKGCTGLVTADISGFKMNGAKSAGAFFQDCTNLVTVIMNNVELKSCTDMNNAFASCSKLTNVQMSGIQFGDIQSFGFIKNGYIKTLNLSGAILGSTKLEKAFIDNTVIQDVNLSGAYIESCTTLKMMFSGCTGLTSVNVDSIHGGKVNNCSRMFEKCTGLTNLTITGFSLASNTTVERMFSECSNLTEVIFVNCSMPKLVKTILMFVDCHNLKKVNLAGLTTGALTNCDCMFENCYNLSISAGDLSGMNTTKTTMFGRMFYNCCYNFDGNASPDSTTINISSFVFNSAKWFDWMFGCDDPSKDLLTTIILPSGDSGKALNTIHTYAMFKNRQSVVEITNLADFKTGTALKTTDGVTKIGDVEYTGLQAASEMFYRVGVSTLDLRGFDFKNFKSAANQMFWGCTELETIYVSPSSVYTENHFYSATEMFFGCGKLVGKGEGAPDFAYAENGDAQEYARVNQDGYPGYFTKKVLD